MRSASSLTEGSRSSARQAYQTAIAALHAGVSFVPILADGTKRPCVRWKTYQQQSPTLVEARRWFQATPHGIAFITGKVSGGLELLDFDTHEVYQAWAERMRMCGHRLLLERIEHGYREETPKGVHLFYRCTMLSGNQKLARKPAASQGLFTSLIETRGEGGYGIVAPSQGAVHPNGKPYRLVCGGVATITAIAPEERASLLSVARTFDEGSSTRDALPPPSSSSRKHSSDRRRPGDIFNEEMSWEELLAQYGWELVRCVDDVAYWRRPGKDEGVSASTNYQQSDLLYVFSTSTCFEAERGYSKFSAYTLLAHHGDFSAAAKALSEQGYTDEA